MFCKNLCDLCVFTFVNFVFEKGFNAKAQREDTKVTKCFEIAFNEICAFGPIPYCINWQEY